MSTSTTTVTSSPAHETAAIEEAINQILTLWSNKKLTVNVLFTQGAQSVAFIEKVLDEGGVTYTLAQEKAIVQNVLQQLCTTYLFQLYSVITPEGVLLLQQMIPLIVSECFALEQEIVSSSCFKRKTKTTKAQVSAAGLVIQRPALLPAAVPATKSPYEVFEKSVSFPRKCISPRSRLVPYVNRQCR